MEWLLNPLAFSDPLLKGMDHRSPGSLYLLLKKQDVHACLGYILPQVRVAALASLFGL